MEFVMGIQKENDTEGSQISVGGGDVIIHNNTAQNEDVKDKKWLVPVITTVIGIVATIIVAWYQLKIGEEQALQAAIERERAVVHNVVQIVEEHVINSSSVDIPRLARLIDLRTREEKLPNKISVLQIIQKAEFNIINSSYLEFEKKNEYKKVFDSIYSKMSFDGLKDYAGAHENVANELAKSIRSGDHETAITALNSLLDLFNQDVQIAQESKKSSISKLSKLFDSNFIWMLLIVQLVLAAFYTFYRQALRRRREFEIMRSHEINSLRRDELKEY
jgi:hypothetical protein